MYKLSRYLIYVHITSPHNNAQHCTLLFSTRSGAFRIIDSGSWEMLLSNQFNNIAESILRVLIKDQIIISSDEDERSTILKENLAAANNSDDLYISIQPTAACPLGCGYCGQKHTSNKMSADIEQALVDRLTKKLMRKKYRSLSITWFGAEPLSGYSTIKSLSGTLIELAKRNNVIYKAKIVTNGLLLSPDIINDLIEKQVRDFEITLDGTAPFHDNRRHTKAGGQTFERIYSNILLLANYPQVSITIRCNVDKRNKEGVKPLLALLVKDGLHKRVIFYVAPIHSWGNDAHLLAAEKQTFADWEVDWMIDMYEMGYPIHYLPKRNKYVCFTVKPDSELVDPYGSVFSCSEVSLVPFYNTASGKNKHTLGSVHTAPLVHENSPWGNFYSHETLSKYDCWECPMLPTCGGGCPKEWSEGRIPCPSTKFNIKQRMLLSYLNQPKQASNNV